MIIRFHYLIKNKNQGIIHLKNGIVERVGYAQKNNKPVEAWKISMKIKVFSSKLHIEKIENNGLIERNPEYQ